MTSLLPRWGPAIALMAAIFIFSSIPSSKLPGFDWADLLFKKGGHALGYGLLAFSYWRGLGSKRNMLWPAWVLALLYAISDEYHQSFTLGRLASWVDVVIDAFGAACGLALAFRGLRQDDPGPGRSA